MLEHWYEPTAATRALQSHHEDDATIQNWLKAVLADGDFWRVIGDADGLGDVRKQELVKSGLALGLQSEDDVFVVDNPYVDCLATDYYCSQS